MTNRARGYLTASRLRRVSDAMVEREGERTLGNRLREAELWLLIDAPRWAVIAGLVIGIFGGTLLVGTVGPASIQEYLLDGTAIANAYIELQPGIITAITIVLGINQLVLSPQFGPVSHQRQRLDDILAHRRDVETNADVLSSPTDPAGFLRTITDGMREQLHSLENLTGDSDDAELRNRLAEDIQDIRAGIDPVADGLDRYTFGQIQLLGVAIHYDADKDIHRLHRVRRMYDEELTAAQSQAIKEVQTVLKQYDVAREFFRTRYLQTQFITFSRMMLYTGVPAILMAHYSVGIIGSGVLTGATVGIPNHLWFESGAFAVTMLPIVVIVTYVARIITIAETSVFIGPFSAKESPE